MGLVFGPTLLMRKSKLGKRPTKASQVWAAEPSCDLLTTNLSYTPGKITDKIDKIRGRRTAWFVSKSPSSNGPAGIAERSCVWDVLRKLRTNARSAGK